MSEKDAMITLDKDFGDSQLAFYEVLQQVGSGTYAVVYKARHKKTKKMYALKQIKMEKSGEEGVPFTVIREISLLKRLRHHPNIVKLHQVINSETKGIALVFEYMYSDLKQFMIREKKLDMSILKSLLYQLLCGTAFCHKHHILHRDLKPQNLLVNGKGELKLADFGLARFNGIPVQKLSAQVVTLWFRAPEVLLGSHKYTTSIDVWSIGCIFGEMSNTKPVFKGSEEISQLKCIFQRLGTPTEKVWKGVTQLPGWKKREWKSYDPIPITDLVEGLDLNGYDLLEAMWKYEPSDRISAESALSHPFFEDLVLPQSIREKYTKLDIPMPLGRH
eukprot:TRINITY_DN8032_c0_g1_i1.p1 TRINITY_DN8032_c0_g1~~TRINITY_DN8032_c0_g1_i1.p1  ORF type:complete len:367 (+),score=42.61 TRINITY_DN8032_c0_g1_i1:106-1101(+)